jgi:hypothetical protein
VWPYSLTEERRGVYRSAWQWLRRRGRFAIGDAVRVVLPLGFVQIAQGLGAVIQRIAQPGDIEAVARAALTAKALYLLGVADGRADADAVAVWYYDHKSENGKYDREAASCGL